MTAAARQIRRRQAGMQASMRDLLVVPGTTEEGEWLHTAEEGEGTATPDFESER